MAFKIHYAAYNTSTNAYLAGDKDQHTITLRVGGSDETGLTETDEGGGLYSVSPSDAQLPAGSEFGLYGSSSTDDVIIVPVSGVRPATMRGTDGANTTTPPTVSEIEDGVWSEVEPTNLALEATSQLIKTAADSTLIAVNGIATGISSRVAIATASAYEHPESGTTDYKVVVMTISEDGLPINADSLPVLTITNAGGTDRSGNITSAIAQVSLGRYEATYTVTNGDTLEPLVVSVTADLDTDTYQAVSLPVVTDAVAVDFTASDRVLLAAAATSAAVATLQSDMDDVIKSGEERTLTRTGKTAVPYTETRV